MFEGILSSRTNKEGLISERWSSTQLTTSERNKVDGTLLIAVVGSECTTTQQLAYTDLFVSQEAILLTEERAEEVGEHLLE